MTDKDFTLTFNINTKTEMNACPKIKTLYFCCILISRFWTVEILPHFNLAFSQRSTSIYQAFDGQTEFLRVFNIVITKFAKI